MSLAGHRSNYLLLIFHAKLFRSVLLFAIHCWFCFVLFSFFFSSFFFFLLSSFLVALVSRVSRSLRNYDADFWLWFFLFVCCCCLCFEVVVGAVGRTPRYENGKQESALPSVVCESGYHLPLWISISVVSVCV